jgi:hypothetical protein
MRTKYASPSISPLTYLLTFFQRYLWLYLIVLKSFLVYISDIFSAVTMLTTKTWSNEIFNKCAVKKISGCIAIPFETGKWLFVGCIIFSFLLVSAFLVCTRIPPLIPFHSLRMKHGRRRRSSPAAISRTRLPTSWQTTTTLSVMIPHSRCEYRG